MRYLVLLICLSLCACAEIQNSSGKAFDNMKSAITSDSTNIWVDPNKRPPSENQAQNQDNVY